ncbi:hypothetical protein [Natronolimnobius baerhuensis]|uniref:hypothetical protein n=1 Tax=Natronolimnobius baerhuensis TaxID=253108 RepID=UPI0015963C32|nr:hypothetical protein [Natronolimnobius baerhuensis]
MDPASVPPLPDYIELVIYSYLLVVAAIGCFLYSRLWRSARDTESSTTRGDGSQSNSQL